MSIPFVECSIFYTFYHFRRGIFHFFLFSFFISRLGLVQLFTQVQDYLRFRPALRSPASWPSDSGDHQILYRTRASRGAPARVRKVLVVTLRVSSLYPLMGTWLMLKGWFSVCLRMHVLTAASALNARTWLLYALHIRERMGVLLCAYLCHPSLKGMPASQLNQLPVSIAPIQRLRLLHQLYEVAARVTRKVNRRTETVGYCIKKPMP